VSGIKLNVRFRLVSIRDDIAAKTRDDNDNQPTVTTGLITLTGLPKFESPNDFLNSQI